MLDRRRFLLSSAAVAAAAVATPALAGAAQAAGSPEGRKVTALLDRMMQEFLAESRGLGPREGACTQTEKIP